VAWLSANIAICLRQLVRWWLSPLFHLTLGLRPFLHPPISLAFSPRRP
jgi:hypothetical protein